MSIEAQKQIRENTMELHEFLKDLTDWEQTVKIKEKKLASVTTKDSGLLPVRGQAQIAQGEEDDKKDTGGAGDDKPLKKAAGSSGHTYDYFRNKWDNFDVVCIETLGSPKTFSSLLHASKINDYCLDV
jgi:hypothetical protein